MNSARSAVAMLSGSCFEAKVDYEVTSGTLLFSTSGVTYESAAPSGTVANTTSFLDILAMAQYLEIDFLSTSWHEGLETLGYGATAEVREALVTMQFSMAFKKPRSTRDRVYPALLTELATLGHPEIQAHRNIQRLIGICWDPNYEDEVRPVLVFEKAHKGNLARFMLSAEGKELDIHRRLSLCKDVTRAVLTMHRCHIIHGDIKPENVLIFQGTSGELFAKVTDFGYSTLAVDDDHVIYLPLSPPWNAPEHHRRGFLFHNAKRADIYSLGLLCMWIMLQGCIDISRTYQDNYEFADRENSHYASWIKAAKANDDLLIIAREVLSSIQGIDEKIKGTIVAFFDRTVCKDPAGRAPNIESVMNLLGVAITEDEDLKLGPRERINLMPEFQVARNFSQLQTGDYRLRRHIVKSLLEICSKHDSTPSTLALQLAFCFKTGFGVPADDNKVKYWLQKSGLEPNALNELMDTAYDRERVIHNSQVSTLVNGGHLGYIDYTLVAPSYGDLVQVEKEYRREILDLQNAFGRDTWPALSHKIVLLAILRGQKDFRRSLDLASELAAELASNREFGQTHNGTLVVKGVLAGLLREEGKYTEAESLWREIVTHNKTYHGENHRTTFIAIQNLAGTLRGKGEFTEAERLLRRALAAHEELHGADHPETLVTSSGLASVLTELAKFNEAELMSEKSFIGHKKVFGQFHPSTLTAANNLGAIRVRMRKYDSAETLLDWTLKAKKQVLGPSHPSTLDTLMVIEHLYRLQGNIEAAEGLCRRVLENQESSVGTEHPDVILAANNLALILLEQGNYVEAQSLLERCLTTSDKILGANHMDTLVYANNLAGLYRKQNKFPLAVRLHRRAVEGSRQVYGHEHPTTLSALSNLALALHSMGENDEAEELLEKALQDKKCLLGSDHPSTLTSLNSLATLWACEKKFMEAERGYKEVIEGRDHVLGKQHARTIEAIHSLAELLFQIGRDDEAEEWVRQEIFRRREGLGSDHYLTRESEDFMALMKHLRDSRSLELDGLDSDIEIYDDACDIDEL